MHFVWASGDATPNANAHEEIETWVKNMDEVGVEKTVNLAMTSGAEFGEIYRTARLAGRIDKRKATAYNSFHEQFRSAISGR